MSDPLGAVIVMVIFVSPAFTEALVDLRARGNSKAFANKCISGGPTTVPSASIELEVRLGPSGLLASRVFPSRWRSMKSAIRYICPRPNNETARSQRSFCSRASCLRKAVWKALQVEEIGAKSIHDRWLRMTSTISIGKSLQLVPKGISPSPARAKVTLKFHSPILTQRDTTGQEDHIIHNTRD